MILSYGTHQYLYYFLFFLNRVLVIKLIFYSDIVETEVKYYHLIGTVLVIGQLEVQVMKL